MTCIVEITERMRGECNDVVQGAKFTPGGSFKTLPYQYTSMTQPLICADSRPVYW